MQREGLYREGLYRQFDAFECSYSINKKELVDWFLRHAKKITNRIEDIKWFTVCETLDNSPCK